MPILVLLIRFLPLLFLSCQTYCTAALAAQTQSAISFQGSLKADSLKHLFGTLKGTDLGESMLLTSEFDFGLSEDIASSAIPITKMPHVAKDIYIDSGLVYEDQSHEGAAVLLATSGEILGAALFTRPCRPYGSTVIYFNCTVPKLKIFLRDRSKIFFVKRLFQNWAGQFLLAQRTNRDWLSSSVAGSSYWYSEPVINPVETSIVLLSGR